MCGENAAKQTIHQIVAPSCVRDKILNYLHNDRLAGHFGRDKTLENVKRRFYWPGMTEDVKRWCEACDQCARRKPGPGVGKSPLQQSLSSKTIESIAIDILGGLPTTRNGNEYIIIVGDYFSKWKEAYAVPNHTAMTVADKLLTEFICCYGTPRQIHTDQGREFESELFKALCEKLGIEKTRTNPYRPQSDGLVERFNRTLIQMLSAFVNEKKNDWDDHLPYLMMAYRATVHESTKCSPNLIMLGRELSLPLDIMVGPPPGEKLDLCSIMYVAWVQNAIRCVRQSKHCCKSSKVLL